MPQFQGFTQALAHSELQDAMACAETIAVAQWWRENRG